MLLISLSVVLLITSAFLLPDDTAPARHPEDIAWEQRQKESAAKPAPLTEPQRHGQQLFVNNCAQCHAVTEEIVVGPGLRGVTVRAPSEAWLLPWIRNSQAVVASGDPYGVQVFNKFNKIAMPSFPTLTDADVRAILSYVDVASTPAMTTLR